MARILKTDDVKLIFIDKYNKNDYVIDKSGVKTIEIVGASFIADEDSIFGEVNWDYVNREIEWYNSCSRYVDDIPGKTPAIWEQVADLNGLINSNYGWCIYSKENYSQYDNCIKAIKCDPDTRRAIMIYNRPNMQYEYNMNDMSDFMCTNAVQYLQRNGEINAIVQMRSNDAVFGYKNDRAWQDYVLTKVAHDTGYRKGKIIWNAGSLHVYERHFDLVK